MRLVPETSPLPRLLVFPFGLLGLFGLALLRWQSDLALHLARCPWRELSGLPCPTCGGTHAAVSLARGRWSEGFTENPLVALGSLLFGLWVVFGLAATAVPALRRSISWDDGEKRTARILAVLVILLTWAWEFRRLGSGS